LTKTGCNGWKVNSIEVQSGAQCSIKMLKDERRKEYPVVKDME
jgi:hypothetical protein